MFKGSINLDFILSGKPPTLWCDLIVWAVEVPDSITSVYKVPCANHLMPTFLDRFVQTYQWKDYQWFFFSFQDHLHLLIYLRKSS